MVVSVQLSRGQEKERKNKSISIRKLITQEEAPAVMTGFAYRNGFLISKQVLHLPSNMPQAAHSPASLPLGPGLLPAPSTKLSILSVLKQQITSKGRVRTIPQTFTRTLQFHQIGSARNQTTALQTPAQNPTAPRCAAAFLGGTTHNFTHLNFIHLSRYFPDFGIVPNVIRCLQTLSLQGR